MAASEADVAAHLIERLLAEPDFRARFRHDPAAACREAGLEQLAQEMALGAGKAMMTLDVRESKSSLAGVMMAAAMEGIGLYGLSEHVLPHLADVPAEVGDVLSRVNLPSVGGALAPAPPVSRAAVVAPPEEAAPPEASSPPAPPEAPAPPETPEAPAPPETPETPAPPETPEAPAPPEAPAQPEPSEAPDAAAPPGPPEAAAAAASAPPEAPAAAPPEAAPAVPVEPVGAAPAVPVDPAQFGAEGAGGTPSAETRALLENDNLVFDSVGRADLEAGRIDPRVVAVLTRLGQEHKITVSCMCSDHSKFTSGGSISNHHFGRGVDIAAVDGVPVNASNFDAREIAMELQDFDESIRPNEIGTPWAIAGPGYFTDAGHQDHLHVGFKQQITPDWTPPAAVAAAPGAAAEAAAPERKAGDSLVFAAVTPKAAAAGASKAAGTLAFIGAVEPEAPAAAGTPVAVEVTGYPGDDASEQQIAAWMASEATKRGLPPELPVMASLVESGLKNLNFGDADSVGFFQMRVGIWNKVEAYAGYPDDPQKQIDWFLDTAEAVKAQRIERGQPIDDPSQYGEWIADIERPAEQYRGRYQLKLDQAQALVKDTPPTPAPLQAPPLDDAARAPVPVVASPVDPSQFGAEGAGGTPSAETQALLKNDNLVFDSTGRADLEAGRIDPRVVAVLTKLGQDHKITVSCMCSDHSKFTSGGSISNHHFGRGVDIAAIDGVPVNASNFDAREIAMELQDFDESIRPNEIGTPWAIAGAGYFTDAGHQDHLHVGFKQQITPDWKPPGAVASAPAAAEAAAPERRAGDSLAFAAVTPKAAAAGASKAAGSLAFIQAVEPQAVAAPVAVDVGYPGDDASEQQIAAWMAAEATKRGLPPELPVMASLVESGLKNLNFGDADSVGFFQMRTSFWNKDEYAGYPDDPQKQIDWFLDQAEAIKAQRIERGQPIDDPNQYGEWIADIERPAEQYRGRYQLKLDQAQRLVKDTPPTPAPLQAPPLEAAAPTGGGAAGASALAALAEAKKHLGTPYQWGGSTPETNFDCSGLVQWSYAQAGIQIPRVTDQQILASNGTAVQRADLLPGDLVFFRDASGYVHHVGMSLGGDEFIHAPSTGDVVKVSSLDEPYYAQQFTGGRRFAAAGAGEPAPAPDPTEVAKAQAHVALDAAEVRRHDSMLFVAVRAQEAAKARATVQFMKAIDPSQVKAASAAAPPEAVAEAPPEPAAAAADVGPAPDLAGVRTDYPGDDASQAELAKWLAKQAEKAGLPPELPVMASLVESGVKNLNFGDADSVGFFQMRVGIWNKGAYAGYPERPELQAKWFIDTALAVKKQRIGAGDVDFGKDPAKWGQWIADVERPAEQYRGRYQLRLGEARTLLR